MNGIEMTKIIAVSEDKWDKLQARNKLLEAVYEAARVIDEGEAYSITYEAFEALETAIAALETQECKHGYIIATQDCPKCNRYHG